MHKSWGYFFALLIPAVVLGFVTFVVTGLWLSKVCLDEWPLLTRAVKMLPLLVPVGIYFLIDRRIARAPISSRVVRTILMAIAVALPLAIAIPSLLHVHQRSKQKETITRILAIQKAVEEIAVRTNHYPQTLPSTAPQRDAWCYPFVYRTDGKSYEITSFGLHGRRDATSVEGATTSYEDDFVFRDGQFVRFPEGVSLMR